MRQDGCASAIAVRWSGCCISTHTEDTFEEVMSFFEETSQRLQPFANVDNAPVLSLDDMEQNVDENVSNAAQRWIKVIYQHWAQRKHHNRAIMPTIKVRVLDTTSEADDADPYVCFRRREVRQTRKTRGRDAQVVEKLKTSQAARATLLEKNKKLRQEIEGKSVDNIAIDSSRRRRVLILCICCSCLMQI